MFLGIDLVHVPGFEAQLGQPGSRFWEVFTPRERAIAREHLNPAAHLAGRWAAKEAVVKAWGQSRYGQPPLLGSSTELWQHIEVVPDPYGRVAVRLGEPLLQHLRGWELRLSISHDGDYAMAQCLMVARAGQ